MYIICIHIYMYIYVYIYIHVYIFVYGRIYTYIHIYIYTYIHIYTYVHWQDVDRAACRALTRPLHELSSHERVQIFKSHHLTTKCTIHNDETQWSIENFTNLKKEWPHSPVTQKKVIPRFIQKKKLSQSYPKNLISNT